MNTISFDMYAGSHNIELLEELHRVSCPDAEIIQDAGMHKISILSVITTGDDTYDTDGIITLIVETAQRLRMQFPMLTENKIVYTLDIRIVVTDADETSIPGITLSREYISLASELGIQTRFHLMISSSTRKGTLNSGAYLYIDSDNEINFPVLNRIAGIQPSVLYRKGCKGRYTVVDFYAWGLEVSSENQLPDVPVSALMRKLKNAKETGAYCKENNLESHVDITCYSIYSEPLRFQLEPSFFTFLKELQVRFVAMDFMN